MHALIMESEKANQLKYIFNMPDPFMNSIVEKE
jgi:hypothetical protein